MELRLISAEIGKVNNYINTLFEETVPDDLREAALYIINAGGKRVRPALVLLSNMAVGGNPDAAIPVATSVELIHTFSLVHDDIMDNDTLRRGKPTIHIKWDTNVAILVGDLLQAKAYECLWKSNNSKCREIVKTIGKTASTLCEGQLLDMQLSRNLDISEKKYLEMVYKKTGCLIESCTKLGAITGNGKPEEVKALSNYGRKVGLAFQIYDDLLDLTADETKFGKPVGSDIREGKITLIVVKVFETEYKDEFLKYFGKNGAKYVNKALEIIQSTNAIEYANNMCKELIESAIKDISILNPGEYKDSLISLARKIISRSY